MCLAQGHNTVTLVGIEPGPLDSESDALPLWHRNTDREQGSEENI